MRLTELNPYLDTDTGDPAVAYLTFDCPHCRGAGYVNVKIARHPHPAAQRVWEWNGETVEKMTLSPSLNFPGHWHGFIRDGEVTGA